MNRYLVTGTPLCENKTRRTKIKLARTPHHVSYVRENVWSAKIKAIMAAGV